MIKEICLISFLILSQSAMQYYSNYNSLYQEPSPKEQQMPFKNPKDLPTRQKVAITVSIGGQIQKEKIVLGLFSDETPKTAENFFEICTNKNLYSDSGLKLSYDKSPFHRIIPQFMIQGGDFTNFNGTGGYSIYGEKFDDENFNVLHDKYVLAMANSGPDTNGSQFFITTVNTSWLNGKHVVFGRVLKGFNMVNMIEGYGSPSGKPYQKIVFESCEDVSESHKHSHKKYEQDSGASSSHHIKVEMMHSSTEQHKNRQKKHNNKYNFDLDNYINKRNLL
jgi:peptidylprolyl isomerase